MTKNYYNIYRRRVNFESRYGIWWDLLSTNAEITFPKADNDKFILFASFRRSPVAPVFDYLSLPKIKSYQPARSTKLSLPAVIIYVFPYSY